MRTEAEQGRCRRQKRLLGAQKARRLSRHRPSTRVARTEGSRPTSCAGARGQSFRERYSSPAWLARQRERAMGVVRRRTAARQTVASLAAQTPGAETQGQEGSGEPAMAPLPSVRSVDCSACQGTDAEIMPVLVMSDGSTLVVEPFWSEDDWQWFLAWRGGEAGHMAPLVHQPGCSGHGEGGPGGARALVCGGSGLVCGGARRVLEWEAREDPQPEVSRWRGWRCQSIGR